jgi:hypothetical protein
MYYYYYYYFNCTENGILPGGGGTAIRHNTQNYTYHTTLKENTEYKDTQTIKDTLHTINTSTTHKKVKLSL